MPIYTFEHPETEELVEIVQKMSDEHAYVDENGVKWNRVWHAPNYSIDSTVNPFSSEHFIRKTEKMRGTVGDLWDYSAELSEKRKQITGRDEIKAQHEVDRATSINNKKKMRLQKEVKWVDARTLPKEMQEKVKEKKAKDKERKKKKKGK